MFAEKYIRILGSIFLALPAIILCSCAGDESASIARNSQGEGLPLIPQEQDNYCAVAVVAAHMEYWGDENPYTQSQMFWFMDSDANGGIDFVEMHDYIANYTSRYYWAVEYNWDSYQRWIACCMQANPGTPPIISVGNGNYHFVSVVATISTSEPYHPTAYIIADPSGRGTYGSAISIPGSFWRVEKNKFYDWISSFIVGDSVLHLGMADESSRWTWPSCPMQGPGWEEEAGKILANALLRSTPYGGRENSFDESIVEDDAGGCPGCPPLPPDTTAFYYDLAVQYIAEMDTMLLSFIYKYCPGQTGWHFGPLRDVLFPESDGSGKVTFDPNDPSPTGQPGYTVVPIVTGYGYEIGSVLIFSGPGNAYGGCAFYPYLELLAKSAGKGDIDNTTLAQFALDVWTKWKLDPDALINETPGKNIISAYSPDLRDCEVEYFFEWGPEPNVPFFHYAAVTYPDDSTKVFDIFGVEYVRGEDNYLHKKERFKPGSAGEESFGLVSDNFALRQNYPNPFNTLTKIEFALSEDGNVRLEVYDILGQRVQTLVNEYKTAGVHRVEFDCRSLVSGIYFYRLTAGSSVETKKMLLMK